MLEIEPEDRLKRKRPERQLYVPPAQRKSSLKNTNDTQIKSKHKNGTQKKEKVTDLVIINSKTENNIITDNTKCKDSIDSSTNNNSLTLEFLLCYYLIQLRWKCSISGTLLKFNSHCELKHHYKEDIENFILQIPLIFFYTYSLCGETIVTYNKYFSTNAFPVYSIKNYLQYTHNQPYEKVPLTVTDFHHSYSDILKQFDIFCDYDIFNIENNLFINNSYRSFPCLHIALDSILVQKQTSCIFDIFDNISDTSNLKISLSNKDNASASDITTINNTTGFHTTHNISGTNQTNTNEKLLRKKHPPKKTDHEEELEIMRKTKEHINRKTRPIMKYVGESNDTLNIEDESIKSWEDLLDDEGEVKEELLCVEKLHKPTKRNKQKEDNFEDISDVKHVEELEHLVELYDFPSSFKTQDLIQAFSNIDCDAMYIKWVDDTHAILVLGTLTQAMKATNMQNPLIKARPMATASRATLAIVHKSDLKPAMKRPQTNLQAARRFITAALGTKIGVSKERMAKEREDLKTARDMKKMLRKNEKDAWEGNLQSSLQ